jgi:hypothetical protein
MDEKRADGMASIVSARQDRRRGERRRHGSLPGRSSTGPVSRLQGPLRCVKNDVGEIVEIWIGDTELLRTVIDCNDRLEAPYFSVTVNCS